MKLVSVAPVVRLALFAGALGFMAQTGFAAEGSASTNNGEVSIFLANQLFCSTVDLLEGDIGLLIGLILIFVGLWSMVQGAKFVAAFPIMIMGALITAIPSLLLSSLKGLSGLLNDSHISKHDFTPPSCPALTPSQKAIDNAMRDRSGRNYPSRGSYDPASLINSMTPDIKYNPSVPPELQN